MQEVRTGIREKGINLQHGMGRQGRMEKGNKSLGTESCETIDNLYLNKSSSSQTGKTIS